MLVQERYRLLKQIGQGGFGKTFFAVDESQFPPVPCIVQQFSWQNQTLEVFEQKVQQLEQLGKHPQIPTLLAHFQQEHYFYLVQEFIEGTNLATLVAEVGAFSEIQIWQLLEKLLPVVKFIHDRNIIHRDIKPQNIICRSSSSTSEGEMVLIDFSTAQFGTAIDFMTTEPGIGSPEYASPEQVKGKPVFASDLYSLGMTCLYLLSLISPFDLFDINNCCVWRQYLTTKISDRLGKILDKLVQSDITQRFQSADEVMQAMGIPSSLRIPNLPLSSTTYTLTQHCYALSSVNSIAISPNHQTLASCHDDKKIRLWDLKTQKVIHTFVGHSQAVRSLAFSPDGKVLATASDDKTIKLWNLDTYQEIFTLCGHTHAVKSVAFSFISPSQEEYVPILASGSWDKTIKIWNVNTGTEICTLTGHQLQVSAVAFSPQGELLASASLDRTIRLWNISIDTSLPPVNVSKQLSESFQPILLEKELKNRPQYTLLGTLSGHAWAVLTVAFSPDGKILATGSEDNTIKLWQVNTGKIIDTLPGHSWSVVALAFSTDGEMLLSGSWDKTVKLWRVHTKKEIVTLSGHVDSVSAVAISPDAQLIASGSRDKTIKLWQPVKQQEN
ncbi:MAG: serine/threonine protein kinase [Rhizonema sp. NSF051]|nr:serine/threonine protein kinase [Rhizonema sp. NSF051]